MDNRVIRLSELRDAVNEAYEKFKDLNDGTVDPRLAGGDSDLFGISLALPDGTAINKGDTSATFPLGQISRVPVMSLKIEQKVRAKAMQAEAGDPKACHCMAKKEHQPKPDIPFCARGIKAVSKLEPTGDPDSKWNFIEDRMTGMIGTAPQLDIKLYEELKNEAAKYNVVRTITDSGYRLADDTQQSVDLYLRSLAMTANVQQLAEMGATIVADGVNPFTRQIVYDGVLSQRIVARMALKSHKLRRFIMKTGLPTVSGFGGGVLGVLPGVFSIAAYSPRLCERGNSVRGTHVLAYIMKKLNLSVFSSAKVVIEK